MKKVIQIIEASIATKQQVLEDEFLLQSICDVVNVIVDAFRTGKRIYFCGNGGSAADAQHLAAEFSGRFYSDRKALPAEALHCNTSYLTAVANDYGYDLVYARLFDGIGETGDILVGLSTSGNSANIVKAFEAAKAKKNDHDWIHRHKRRANETFERFYSECSFKRYSTHPGKSYHDRTYHLPIGRRKIFRSKTELIIHATHYRSNYISRWIRYPVERNSAESS